MKKLFIISLTLAFGIGSLWAEDKPAKKERKPAAQRDAPPNREAILKKFDKDGDGELNKEEGAAAKAALAKFRAKPVHGVKALPNREAMIKKFDSDGDG